MAERFSATVELTKARFREFFREPGAVFWVFGFPLMLALALGIAFRSRPPARAHVAVLSDAPAWLVDALESSDRLDLRVLGAAEAERALRVGAVDALVLAPEGERERRVVYRFDPTRDEARVARLVADDVVQRALGRVDAVLAQDVAVVEPGGRYVDFLFPGLLGMNLMASSMWGIGYSVVLARRRRLLKRLAATPMRRWQYLLAYFLSRLGFVVLEVAVLLVFGALIFEVETQGSVPAVFAVSILGAASFAAISLLIAARVESLEAANGWLNFVMLPMWLCSGSFFTYARFPEALHPLLRALPLTALNDALRALVNDGDGIVACAPELAVLGAWTLVSFMLALRSFRWQ